MLDAMLLGLIGLLSHLLAWAIIYAQQTGRAIVWTLLQYGTIVWTLRLFSVTV